MTTNQTQEVATAKAPFLAPTKKEDFATGETEIRNTDEKGETTVYLLLSDGGVAIVREGKGTDVEKASIESGKDQSKYMSSMMASCVTVDGKRVNMYDLAAMKMKDYMKIQVAFAELNF